MSHWHLTLTEVALIAPLGGAPVGALIAYAASRWTTKATTRTQREVATVTLEAQRALAQDAAKAQRELASDERFWNHRAEVYAELTLMIQQAHMAMVGSVSSWPMERLEGLTKYLAQLVDRTHVMTLFAGEVVIPVWANYFKMCQTLSHLGIDLRDKHVDIIDQFGLPEPGDLENTFKAEYAALDTYVGFARTSGQEVILAMRTELQGQQKN